MSFFKAWKRSVRLRCVLCKVATIKIKFKRGEAWGIIAQRAGWAMVPFSLNTWCCPDCFTNYCDQASFFDAREGKRKVKHLLACFQDEQHDIAGVTRKRSKRHRPSDN